MANVETASAYGHTGFEDMLSRIEQFDKPALLQFAGLVNGLVYKKNQTSAYETLLVKKIKNNIPPSIKRRQKELFIKMENNALSVPEKDELMILNDMIEEKTAEKIRLMGELAQLRRISIGELNQQLYPNHA